MIATSLFKKIYLFEKFTESELKQVAEISLEKDVIAGDSIFGEGSPATALFIVKEGTVEILKTGAEEKQRIASFSSGSHFGEMAFLDRAIRTASAIAAENSKLIEIPYDKLDRLTQQNLELGNKFYRAVALTLATRIQRTTVDLSNLKDLKLRHI